ncbi:MAG TPA: DUF6438 domain-containing protein [Saprospiraceae bacterium]|nr:DUF6438 domain-containing protein [Saprospiraceae bacterium]
MKFIGFAIIGLLSVCFTACHKKLIKSESKIEQKSDSIPPLPVFIKRMHPSDTNVQNVPLLMTFQKTACFGFCPVFEFRLYRNGICHYDGKQFTPIQGQFYDLMEESEWQNIKNKVDSVGFFALEENYPVSEKEVIMDLPKTVTTMFLNGRTKKITNSHSAPQPLKELESLIQQVIDRIVEKHLN